MKMHIQNRPIRPQLDPQNQKDCLVHILQREGAARGIPVMVHPIPEENVFVAPHRATMPAPRCLVVNIAGRALGRVGAARRRGRRGAARGGVTGGTATRTRGARAKGPLKRKINKNKTRGMAWLLFGGKSTNTQARAGQEKQHEKQSTQGALGCDD